MMDAQIIPLEKYHDYKLNAADSSKFFLEMDNSNFLINNEYFNKIVVGYTLIGFSAKPEIIYHPTFNTKISVGGYLLKYSGLDNFTTVMPVLTFQYQPTNEINILMGTMKYHQLVDPIYQPERYFTNNVENGLQFLFNYSHIQSDIWLTWEKFIFNQSPYKEEMSVGTSTRAELLNPAPQLNIDFSFQSLVCHKGGQIDTLKSVPLQTLINTATGLTCQYNSVDKNSNIGFRFFMLTFNDLSQKSVLQYQKGFGYYPQFFVKLKSFSATFTYWDGHDFFAKHGAPMFSSISTIDATYTEENRKLSKLQFAYSKQIGKNIFLNANIDVYYIPIQKLIDYAYGMQIIYRPQFLISKINQL